MGKMDKSIIPKLNAPLSELTKNFEHVPVQDMNAWCNRPLEQREHANQIRVSRPLNSFMLYKKAYRDRCQVWCLSNDNRIVSGICGQSWKLEPPEIRLLYTQYADVDRRNHAEAHPQYKFSPHRAQKTPSRKSVGKGSGRKRYAAALEMEDELDSEQPRRKSVEKSRRRKRITAGYEADDEADSEQPRRKRVRR